MGPVHNLLIKIFFLAAALTVGLACDYGWALTFTVNSPEDAADSHPGNGVCSDSLGRCTLRAAVMEANARGGGDSVYLPAGTYTLSVNGRNEDGASSGDLDIGVNLAINGENQETTIIDGGGIDRVLHMKGLILVTLNDLTIQNGADQNPAGQGMGGGIFNDENAFLKLFNVTLKNNKGNSPFTSGMGGGIYNHPSGQIELYNVSLIGNEAAEGGHGLGGGIHNKGTLVTFKIGSLKGNLSQVGGGLYNSGTANLEEIAIEDNYAGAGVGGGIYNGGFLTINKATISGRADEGSGADTGGGLINNGVTSLTNVTFSGNKVSRYGGGIYNGQVEDIGASVTLTNVTLNSNTASNGGGGIYNTTGNIIDLKNTIIANSIGGNCSGVITSNGHNLEDENSCGLSGTGDLINTNPNLGPLEDNEGPTLTHALILPSPAINAGDNNGCPATDQRGVRRPLGPTCDIGAYEYNPFIHSLFLPLVIRN